MSAISADLHKLIQLRLHKAADLRTESAAGGVLAITYLTSLVDEDILHRSILEPLGRIPRGTEECIGLPESVLGMGCLERHDVDDCLNDLLNGRVIVHAKGESSAFSFLAAKGAARKPKDPKIERTIRGPRLDFVETLNDSIALIRRQIKDPRLRVDGVTLGRRSQTELAVAYLEDVADPGIVREVFTRLSRIDIDGIPDGGYIEQLITDNPRSILPLTHATERPDKAVSAILEGRVLILVDGSAWAIIVPTTLNDLYQSSEDYYFNRWIGSFLRFFRILGNNLAVVLPGLYIALAGVNPELLPTQLALTFAGSRAGVAFPLVVELLAMEIIVEVFREAGLRLPSTVGQTLGTVAGIVLGLASVRAGIVSDATLVVVTITAISSFSGPNFSIGLAWRLLRYLFIIAAATFGLFGLTVFGIVVIAHAAMQNSFGVSYLSPWAPLDLSGLGDTVIRRPLTKQKRPKTYHPLDAIRFQDGGDNEK